MRGITKFYLPFVFLGYAMCSLAQPVSPPGIISWWRGESSAADALGQNNGTLVNGATFATGQVGTAFSFNGTSQYFYIPDSPSLRTASLTLECWAMFTDTNGFRMLMAKPVGSGINDSFALWFNSGVLYGAEGDETLGGPVLSCPFAPVIGQWYHFAYTFDSASLTQALYFNGSVVVSSVAARPPGYDSAPMQVGADSDNGTVNGFFAGKIDEPTIYSRALTSAEIAGIYGAGTAGKSTNGPYFNTPSQLPAAALNVGYTQQISVLFSPSATFVVAQGSVPGLSLNSTGLLSGVPTSSGSFTLNVHVTDTNGAANAKTFSLNVSAPVPPPPGIISWWRAEGNSADSVGGNDAIWNGSSFYPTGEVGQAFDIRGPDT